MKIVVGITGATGAIYGIRLLEELCKTEHHVSLILSPWAEKTIALETSYSVAAVAALADAVYDNEDLAAPLASGSHRTGATVIAPCSMKTLAAVAHGFGENLICRAADVALKERRPLVLVPRETPLTQIHLENMSKASACGAVLLPPMPAFYHKPQTIDDLINQTVGKILDVLDIPCALYQRWEGAQ